MQDELTKFLLQFTLLHKHTQEKETIINQELMKTCPLSSQQLLSHIFETLNYDRKHRFSLSSDETGSHTQTKCNCKKSKCLKLYCECFAQGSLCKNCNCDCCQNTEQYSQIRAKAIDQLIMRTTVGLGPKGSTLKGCNCKKTGCLKKYCQCFNAGQKCGEYCKCNNCSNCE